MTCPICLLTHALSIHDLIPTPLTWSMLLVLFTSGRLRLPGNCRVKAPVLSGGLASSEARCSLIIPSFWILCTCFKVHLGKASSTNLIKLQNPIWLGWFEGSVMNWLCFKMSISKYETLDHVLLKGMLL